MNKLSTLGDEIEAKNLWELDRVVERAMDALRLPPGDADTKVLSGGEKRRVSLCQLLLGNHDMLLLGKRDEDTGDYDYCHVLISFIAFSLNSTLPCFS